MYMVCIWCMLWPPTPTLFLFPQEPHAHPVLGSAPMFICCFIILSLSNFFPFLDFSWISWIFFATASCLTSTALFSSSSSSRTASSEVR